MEEVLGFVGSLVGAFVSQLVGPLISERIPAGLGRRRLKPGRRLRGSVRVAQGAVPGVGHLWLSGSLRFYPGRLAWRELMAGQGWRDLAVSGARVGGTADLGGSSAQTLMVELADGAVLECVVPVHLVTQAAELLGQGRSQGGDGTKPPDE